MKVLVIGNGGREHAIAWKVAQSDDVSHVFVAPGNVGTATEKKVQNINITDIAQLVLFAQQMKIDLTIVGPEGALAAGITDQFQKADLTIFAPTKAAAQLEISKKFSKDFMVKHNIPTAAYASFTELEPALAYLKAQTLPIVIKADGLASGKGVIITDNLEHATDTLTTMLSGDAFGGAGKCVVIEEFLKGTELSYIVMVDGKNVLPLASSKDHKHRDNGDVGPNTGGMGAVSPSPLLTPDLEKIVLEKIIYPTVNGMAESGAPYTGFLYAGLMIDADGNPKTLEFNCRLGDPETQALLPRLTSDLAALCMHGAQGTLDKATTEWNPQSAITIVLTAGGYPSLFHVGDPINGLKSLGKNVKVFLAGAKMSKKGLVTNSGRVLSITALGETLQLAYNTAYNAAEKVTWKNCYYRTDIGLSCMTQQLTSA
ncbi:MAG: phosphoribosylamine--glycine ligase [Coxiella sp. (in: Bacteria)]|nr:MAG: phosphoribosylamine--glycine ligase [Coxiella sp. (in: g-proteobacteria)]